MRANPVLVKFEFNNDVEVLYSEKKIIFAKGNNVISFPEGDIEGLVEVLMDIRDECL